MKKEDDDILDFGKNQNMDEEMNPDEENDEKWRQRRNLKNNVVSEEKYNSSIKVLFFGLCCHEVKENNYYFHFKSLEIIFIDVDWCLSF